MSGAKFQRKVRSIRIGCRTNDQTVNTIGIILPNGLIVQFSCTCIDHKCIGTHHRICLQYVKEESILLVHITRHLIQSNSSIGFCVSTFDIYILFRYFFNQNFFHDGLLIFLSYPLFSHENIQRSFNDTFISRKLNVPILTEDNEVCSRLYVVELNDIGCNHFDVSLIQTLTIQICVIVEQIKRFGESGIHRNTEVIRDNRHGKLLLIRVRRNHYCKDIPSFQETARSDICNHRSFLHDVIINLLQSTIYIGTDIRMILCPDQFSTEKFQSRKTTFSHPVTEAVRNLTNHEGKITIQYRRITCKYLQLRQMHILYRKSIIAVRVLNAVIVSENKITDFIIRTIEEELIFDCNIDMTIITNDDIIITN